MDTYSVGIRITSAETFARSFALFAGLVNTYRSAAVSHGSAIPITFNYETLSGYIATTGSHGISGSTIILEDNPSNLNVLGVDADFVVTTPFKAPFRISDKIKIERITGNWDVLRNLAKFEGIKIKEIFIRSANPLNFEQVMRNYELRADKSLYYHDIPVQDYFKPDNAQNNIIIIDDPILIDKFDILTFKVLAGNTLDISCKIETNLKKQ